MAAARQRPAGASIRSTAPWRASIPSGTAARDLAGSPGPAVPHRPAAPTAAIPQPPKLPSTQPASFVNVVLVSPEPRTPKNLRSPHVGGGMVEGGGADEVVAARPVTLDAMVKPTTKT